MFCLLMWWWLYCQVGGIEIGPVVDGREMPRCSYINQSQSDTIIDHLSLHNVEKFT